MVADDGGPPSRLRIPRSQCARLITEHEFLDLSGRSLGQRAIDKFLWNLEARQARLAEGDDLFVVWLRSAGLEFEECAGSLAPLRVGTSHHGRQHDCWMLREHLFDFK